MTREEAIEILKQFKKCLADVVFDEKGSEAWQMAIQALSQEPKSGKWIPVSERLPEIGDYVLCSIADHHSKHKIIISQYNREDFWSNGIIEAWMPLPKPYEPQESEDKE